MNSFAMSIMARGETVLNFFFFPAGINLFGKIYKTNKLHQKKGKRLNIYTMCHVYIQAWQSALTQPDVKVIEEDFQQVAPKSWGTSDCTKASRIGR